MIPQFLRAAAVRFQGMADTAGRAPAKLRLLGMAADHASRAAAADGLTQPKPGEAIKGTAGRKTAGLAAA
jgi:hypothetical protein